MSYCYICGQTNARFKRYIQTGNSVGYSNGNKYENTHYGNKFFCEACAFNYDYQEIDSKIGKRIFLIILIIGIYIYLLN